MKIHTLTVILSIVVSSGTMAQDQASGAHPPHNCMMISGADWESLKLSPEQLTGFLAVQKEHESCKDLLNTNPQAFFTSMDQHEGAMKAILTKEQYDGWMELCAKLITPTGPARR